LIKNEAHKLTSKSFVRILDDFIFATSNQFLAIGSISW